MRIRIMKNAYGKIYKIAVGTGKSKYAKFTLKQNIRYAQDPNILPEVPHCQFLELLL